MRRRPRILSPEAPANTNIYGAARAGPSSDSFQADAEEEVDFASSGDDELKMLRRSISDPVSTALGNTTPDARTGPHITQSASASSTTAEGDRPRDNTSTNPSPSMSSSRSAAPPEDEHKGDTGSGIAGPVDHRASPDIVLAEDVGSRSESGIQGSASESGLSQPVRTTSPEDVIAQTHDQRKGPGETGMLGKYATHTDTTTTTFSFRSVTIGHAPDRGSVPDSQTLRRVGGSKPSKRSTTKVQTSRSTKKKTREQNERRGPERDRELLASSAGVLSEQASSEETKLGNDVDCDDCWMYGCRGQNCESSCPEECPTTPAPTTTAPPTTQLDTAAAFTATQIDLGHYAHLTASRALLAVGQRADGVHPDQNATQNDPNSSTTCAETQKRGGAENRWWQITSRTDEPGAEMDAFRLYNNDAGLTSRLDNASVEVYSSKASSDANAPDWELPDVGNIRAASDGGTVIYLGNTRLPVYRLRITLAIDSWLTLCGFEALLFGTSTTTTSTGSSTTTTTATTTPAPPTNSEVASAKITATANTTNAPAGVDGASIDPKLATGAAIGAAVVGLVFYFFQGAPQPTDAATDIY